MQHGAHPARAEAVLSLSVMHGRGWPEPLGIKAKPSTCSLARTVRKKRYHPPVQFLFYETQLSHASASRSGISAASVEPSMPLRRPCCNGFRAVSAGLHAPIALGSAVLQLVFQPTTVTQASAIISSLTPPKRCVVPLCP